MKRFFLSIPFALAVMFIAGTPFSGLACTFQYSLKDPGGKITSLIPGKDIPLSVGGSYTLSVTFIPDHRNCATPVEATTYLLEEEKWKSAKDALPLKLVSQSGWIQESSQRYTQTIVFTAMEKGRFDLEIVRDCPKGGYDDYLTFVVK